MDIDLDIISDRIRIKMINEISGLELPEAWTPTQVIDYIIYILEKGR
jgi:hypothetical protein